MVCLEKLMGEVLGHEGKHQIGSLRVRPELLSLKKPLSQNVGLRKNGFACRGRKTNCVHHLPRSRAVCEHLRGSYLWFP